MSNLAFDTHQFVLDLTKAKMPESQAEALARHYANLLNDRLATKDDLILQGLAFKEDMNVLEQKMDAEFAAVRSEMASEFANVRSEMHALIRKLTALIKKLTILKNG